MNLVQRYFPWAFLGVVMLVVAGLLGMAFGGGRRTDHEMDLIGFGQLPVVEGGRVKPFDSVARASLMVINDRQDFVDADGKKQPAIKWLLDVITNLRDANGPGRRHPVFRIDNFEVLDMMGLKARASHRYAIDEFAPKIEDLAARATLAEKKEEANRSAFDVKILELARQVKLYIDLEDMREIRMVPPSGDNKEWRTLPEALMLTKHTNQQIPALDSMIAVLTSYRENKPTAFNQELANYKSRIKEEGLQASYKGTLEAAFNRFEPFYVCTVLYVLVFILVCMSWLFWPRPLSRAALYVAAFTVMIHFGALIARMYLMDRWLVFVTNLYSSAIFIGFGCVLMGLVLELLYGRGIGLAIASVLGFLSMLVAHNLASGDTMQMLQAVLDTNFWLATHVTTVTFGYAATFLAGGLGVAFILLGFFTPALDRSLMQILAKMLYGIICFATLLSFTGTVLGGIWADYSWGRFWGWDPKENGALIIVLWNALILHARWGGLVKQRGMAVLAVFGNIVTAWSWFGTNMLPVGLHSYGRMEGAVFWLATFDISQLAVMALGMVPTRFWYSFKVQNDPTLRPSGRRPRGRQDELPPMVLPAS